MQAIQQPILNRDNTIWLQQALNRVQSAGVAEDGRYGPQTEQAVQAFQKEVGLEPNGVAGPATLEALQRAAADPDDRVHSDPDVVWLQGALNWVLGTELLVDGVYGEETRRAIRSFQRQRKLFVDGEFGSQTRSALQSALAQMTAPAAPAPGPFSDAWMKQLAEEWNRDPEIRGPMQEIGFTARIALGFDDSKQPEAIFEIEKGEAIRAGAFDGEPVEWDLRAPRRLWDRWIANSVGLEELAQAHSKGELRLLAGDFEQLMSDPGPFVALIRAMGRVGAAEPPEQPEPAATRKASAKAIKGRGKASKRQVKGGATGTKEQQAPTPETQPEPIVAIRQEPTETATQTAAPTEPPTQAPSVRPAPPPIQATNQPTPVIVQLTHGLEPPANRLILRLQGHTATLQIGDEEYASPLDLDETELRQLQQDSPQRYGERLFSGVIRTQKSPATHYLDTRHGFQEAMRRTAGDLRLELRIDANNPELRALQWEFLKDPASEHPPLAVNERTPLYRSVGSADGSGPAPIPIKVLVVLASPENLARPSGNPYLEFLPALDLAQARAILTDALTPLADAGMVELEFLDRTQGRPATVRNLTAALEQGHQVLHLLAHGLYTESGKYCVVLDGEQEPHQLVTAPVFRTALAGSRLRLAVLETCQSFSVGSVTSGQALGLDLIEAGIPAVISMQGKLALDTAQLFNQHFYHDLARSGRAEMAMAATRRALYQARRTVGTAWDWGTPVLQMGVKDGRLFEVDEKKAAALGAPHTRIKPPETLPSSRQRQQGAGLAESIAAQVGRVVATGGDGVDRQALEERIRESIARAIPSGIGSDSGDDTAVIQDREQLRWAIRGRLKLPAHDLKQWIEGRTGMRLLDALYHQVCAALNAGKHLVLIGPPGTGKTTLAHAICDFARDRGFATGSVPTTASADWTSFDTVGGYTLGADQRLAFRPGIFLRAIATGQWLVIDEINRAEIDKAVGELFTLLSGQQVDLPYRIANQPVRLLPPSGDDPDAWVPEQAGRHDFVVHPGWRILATMNVYDKSSLFSLSFAFMRRFAFVDVAVPHHDGIFHDLRATWIEDRLADHTDADQRAALADALDRVFAPDTPLMRRRELGPAIARDMIRYIAERAAQGSDDQPTPAPEELLGESFMLYALPQLDGLDRAAILEIHDHLGQTLFGGTGIGPRICARLQDLYAHIHPDEWAAASRSRRRRRNTQASRED